MDAATIDRAVGAVLASAVGDALGAPYEFRPPNPTAPCAMEGGGSFAWEPGEWTDDTQMALAILCVLARGSTDVTEIGEEMVRWYASRPRDVGIQTQAVLGAVGRDRATAAESAAAYQAEHPEAAGNGALMRTGPVALAHLGDRPAVAKLAADVASLTHPHPDSVHACVLWSLAIERAITTARPDEALDWHGAVVAGLDHIPAERRELWRTRIDESLGRDPAELHAKNGWVVRAFQEAIAAITFTADAPRPAPCDHLADALRLAARSGGDTDTVAAIAGSLLGARWGATAIPLAWRRPLHGRRAYDEPPIPGRELDSMARLAANGGEPDSKGWPGVEHLVSGYVRDYGLEPVDVELDDAWFGNAADVEGAIDDGATVVVSLCRMGTHDVPPTIEQHTIGLIDSNSEDNPNLVFVLRDTAATIDDLVQAGERVFVHCVSAENRTPAIAAAYLMTRGASLDSALRQVGDAFDGGPRQRFIRDGLEHLEANRGPAGP
jgi:ADP-ribosyl-[dinitrogen reductase] hydrolase